MQNEHAIAMNWKDNGGSNYSIPFHFKCPENTYQTINGGYSPLNDAFYFGDKTHEMYKKWANMKPLKNAIKLIVHYGNKYGGASYSNGKVFIGDGDFVFYPLTDSNVLSHEIAHGVTAENSRLRYIYKSGGLNEAFSDMAGEALEYYLTHLTFHCSI